MMAKERNMKISVSNYGPIAEAKDIELCPLTVFVGPSNTGKSYLAVLIHALFNFPGTGHRFLGARYIRYSYRRAGLLVRKNLTVESTDGNINHLLTQFFKTMDEDISFSNLPEELQKWANKKIAEEINDKFHQEISRCMGTSLKENDLARNGFKFNFEDDRKKVALGSFDTIPSMEIKKSDFNRDDLRDIREHMLNNKRFSDKLRREVFLDLLLNTVFDSPYRRVESLYLPAARTGIMQSHRVIVGALVQRATSAGLEALSVPTLSGVLSDFIQEVILMDTSRRTNPALEKIADIMEKNILHGSIKVEGSEANQYPQLL